MNENVKNGLLIFVAALLVVNTVLLVTNGSSSYDNPKVQTPGFERTANNDMASVANVSKKEVLADMKSIDPMKSDAKRIAGPVTQMDFKESSHDFGRVNQDTENKKIFKFTNSGSEPLIIENAKGSCGCTVPEYPKEPIAPGATGEIKVVYKPGKQKNKQSKTVTITANTEPSTTILTISADVQEIAS